MQEESEPPVSEIRYVPAGAEFLPLKLKRLLLGGPIPSFREKHRRLSKSLGLAVFSSDALSSVVYATDLFITSFFLLIVVGLIEYVARPTALLSITPTPPASSRPWFLILRAFASGCTALTGVEAVSNVVQAFSTAGGQKCQWHTAVDGLNSGDSLPWN